MLRVLLVDDEAPARKRLQKLLRPLEEAGRVEVVAEADDGEAALQVLDDHDVDLLFLDIQMPELDGFAVLERLHPHERPVVVFTTAYDEYALRAFEANAIDYLLKPIPAERLEEAVGRAERVRRTPEARRLSDARIAKLLDWMDAHAEAGDPVPRSGEYLRQISIPYRDRILIFPTSRIVCAEINEGITRMYIEEETAVNARDRLRQHIVSYTLDQLESNLDPDAFMRVHRSALVRLDAIEEMIPWFSGRFKLVLTAGHEVIASRERSKLLKERLLI